jgi:hypothetical protein
VIPDQALFLAIPPARVALRIFAKIKTPLETSILDDAIRTRHAALVEPGPTVWTG